MIKQIKIYFSIFVVFAFLFSCNNSEIITEKERDWLLRHPNLVVGLSPNAPPYQFINEKGEISGIFIDFLAIIENRIDYKFSKIYESDFSKLLASTKDSTVDVVLEIQATAEREKFLNFSPALLSHNHVIVTRKNQQNISSVEDLRDKNIAVVNMYAVEEFLSRNYPDYKLIPLFDDVVCLRAVSTGEADAFICQQAVATFYIENQGISNLKIAGEINYANHLAIASRKDLDTLNIILTKAVNSISKNEKLSIYNNWLSYTVKPFYQQPKFLILVAVVMFFILSISFLFNNILKKRVKRKTKELLKAKNEAEKSEQRFALLFHSCPESLTVTALEDGRFLMVNEAFLKKSGFEKHEVINRTSLEINVWLSVEDRQNWANELVTKGTVRSREIRFRLKNNIVKDFLVSSDLIEFDDKRCTINFYIDISDRKTIETELTKAKEKAEESDRLKTAFLQNMSHEIRTPLNAICGFSEFLKNPDLPDNKRNNFITFIQNSSNQLLTILNDILTIASLETKQEKLFIEKVCINNIILELLTVFKQQAVNQNIDIHAKQFLTDRESEIFSDAAKITQVLNNLISNALKFTPRGIIEFGYTLKNNELEFFVKDTGKGISPEMQDKIFERFRQADLSITKNYGGNGLGLSISKGFVEMLGGKIWVNSKLEAGSTFFFTIPYNPVFKTDSTNVTLFKAENSKNVLVAEDEVFVFLFIKEALANLNISLIHAKNGREVIDICTQNPDIHLILMDIKMPVIDGHEAAKQIKLLKPNLPIIAQTAYALENERNIYEHIFDDYLTKPLNKNLLIETIQKYIGF